MALDSLGSLFRNAFKIYKAKFLTLVEICVVPAAVIGVGDLLLYRNSAGAILLGNIMNLLGIVVSIFASVAFVSAIGRGTDFGASYERGVKLFWAAIWVGILNGVAIIGGFVLLIIPGILLMIWLVFSNFTLVLEDKRGIKALLASKEYVKGFWWAIVGREILLFLVWFAVALIIYAPAATLLGPIGGGIVYAILLLLFVPFAMCYVFEIYANLRRLKPDIDASAAKTGKEFLKVCMVIGSLAVVGLVVLGVAFGAWTGMRPEPYMGGYPGYPVMPTTPGGTNPPTVPPVVPVTPVVPGMATVSPVSGPVGTAVTVTFTNAVLGASNKVLMGGLVAAENVPSSGGGTELQFTVPRELAPNCNPGMACPDFLELMGNGPHAISILVNDTGEPISAGTFTVSGAPTGVAEPQ